MRFLKEFVSASSFDEKSWQEALVSIEEWLKKHQLSASEVDKYKYIFCCAEAAAARPFSGTLASYTAEMLEAYGMERAEKIIKPS